MLVLINLSFPCGSYGKESACNVGGPGLIPGSGKSPGEGNSNPLQYSCLENSKDRGAWLAIVHGIAESQTWLSSHTHTEASFVYFLSLIPLLQEIDPKNIAAICQKVFCLCFPLGVLW